MDKVTQKKALHAYRSRPSEGGMARFEVIGLDKDRSLIRSLAKRLAQDDFGVAEIRAIVQRSLHSEPPQKGGVLAALRRSPLVGAELELPRCHDPGRKVEL